MKKIYSKIQPDLLLHMVYDYFDLQGDREDISPNEEYLQVAALSLEYGKTFKPHKHIEQIRTTDIAQESWIIISGMIEATYYDIDDTILDKHKLGGGDITITFRGGHNYKSLSENTRVYEYKTGPYQGQEKDKIFIDGWF